MLIILPYGNIKSNNAEIEYFESGIIKTIVIEDEESELITPIGEYKIKKIEFFETGKIKRIEPFEPIYLETLIGIFLIYSANNSTSFIEFDENENVNKISVNFEQVIIEEDSKKYEFRPHCKRDLVLEFNKENMLVINGEEFDIRKCKITIIDFNKKSCGLNCGRNIDL